MSNLLLSFILMLQFGIKGDIKKTFSQTDITYIEKRIPEHTLLALNGRQMTVTKEQALLWIQFLMKDQAIVSTKVKKNRKTHSCDVIIRFNNGSYIDTAVLSFEYRKGKVVKIYGK